MIDLHTHSLFSDGVLIPSELVRRLEHLGYSAVAITDHTDSSTLDFIVPRIGHVARLANDVGAILVLNSDAHAPGDFMTEDFARKVVEGAGLPADSLSTLLSNSRLLLEKIGYHL